MTPRQPLPYIAPKPHRRVLRAFVAIVGIGALVATAIIASDIPRDLVSSGRVPS